MSRIAPNPLPKGYGAEGLEPTILERLGCESDWTVDYEITVPTNDGYWSGFVHEFALSGHSTAETCYVLWNRPLGKPQQVFVFQKDDRVRAPEDAVRWMLAEVDGTTSEE